MDDFCGRFRFVNDMNGDFMLTLSDVWLRIKFIWLLPAKVGASFVHSNPTLTDFFEINCSTGESWGGGIFSLAVWCFITFLILSKFRNKRESVNGVTGYKAD